MKKIVIIAGGEIEADFATTYLVEADYKIAVDRGALFLQQQGMAPDLLVGDFDSISKDLLACYLKNEKVEIHRCNPIKDASDTEIALILALEKISPDGIIYLLGATGGRLDHFWSNVQVLKVALDRDVDCRIVNSRNQIRLLKGDVNLEKADCFGKYFSLFPLGSPVEQFSLTGAKYNLENYVLSAYSSRCLSNERLDDVLSLRFPEGIVIFMESKD